MGNWILKHYEPGKDEKIFTCETCGYELHLMSKGLSPVIADKCPKCRTEMTGTIFDTSDYYKNRIEEALREAVERCYRETGVVKPPIKTEIPHTPFAGNPTLEDEARAIIFSKKPPDGDNSSNQNG